MKLRTPIKVLGVEDAAAGMRRNRSITLTQCCCRLSSRVSVAIFTPKLSIILFVQFHHPLSSRFFERNLRFTESWTKATRTRET